MMHGREKSDSAIVAGKPTNKAGQLAAEPVEPRAEAEGNASQQSTRRTQSRVSVSHALERIRQNRNEKRFAVTHPRWEPSDFFIPRRFFCSAARAILATAARRSGQGWRICGHRKAWP